MRMAKVKMRSGETFEFVSEKPILSQVDEDTKTVRLLDVETGNIFMYFDIREMAYCVFETFVMEERK